MENLLKGCTEISKQYLYHQTNKQMAFVAGFNLNVEPEWYQVVHGRYTSNPGTKNQKLFPILHICQNRVLHGQRIHSVQVNA